MGLLSSGTATHNSPTAARSLLPQVRLIAALHLGLAALGATAGILLLVFLKRWGTGVGDPLGMIPIITVAMPAMLFASALPSLVAGIGLLAGRSWARVLGLVASALQLLNFPLGTILAVWSYVVLTNDAVVRHFESSVRGGARR